MFINLLETRVNFIKNLVLRCWYFNFTTINFVIRKIIHWRNKFKILIIYRTRRQ